MNRRRTLMMGAVKKSWRNFAENPMTWTDHNAAFATLEGKSFSYEIDYIDYGTGAMASVFRYGGLNLRSYNEGASSSSPVRLHCPIDTIISSATATNKDDLRILGTAIIGSQPSYANGTRIFLTIAVDVDNSILTVSANDTTLTTPVVLKESWSTNSIATNFNGHIFSCRLKDGDGNVVWEAPLSDLRA